MERERVWCLYARLVCGVLLQRQPEQTETPLELVTNCRPHVRDGERGSVLVQRTKAPRAWVVKAALGLCQGSLVDVEDRLQALCLEGLASQEETAGLCWRRKVGVTSLCGQHCHARVSCSLCSIHSRGRGLGPRAGPAAEATVLLGVHHCCWFLAGEHPAWGPMRSS